MADTQALAINVKIQDKSVILIVIKDLLSSTCLVLLLKIHRVAFKLGGNMLKNKNWLYILLAFFILVVLVVLAFVFELPVTTNVKNFVIGEILIPCESVMGKSMRSEPGPGQPGVSGAGRWGIPEEAPTELRIRRSWSSLTNEEKQQYVDGILLLKRTTFSSGLPGSERTDYESFCAGQYERNLYDYYVELHASAFVTMGGSSHHQMAHMGPHFLPWHRYLILRMEHDMQIVLNDPNFTLPYWDWDDCQAQTAADGNPCPEMFDPNLLGSYGGLEDDADVTGYLTDQGYQVYIWTEGSPDTLFNTDSIRCGARPLRRSVALDEITSGLPPSSSYAISEGYQRPVYDAEPYDQCTTDDSVSFRMFLEGFRTDDNVIECFIAGGCANHGLGHTYVGGDMVQVGTTDPIFFMHHANVDRIWAMWQDHNRENPETSVNYGNPGFPDMWRIALFNYPDIQVEEMFDFRALGYLYDTSPQD